MWSDSCASIRLALLWDCEKEIIIINGEALYQYLTGKEDNNKKYIIYVYSVYVYVVTYFTGCLGSKQIFLR